MNTALPESSAESSAEPIIELLRLLFDAPTCVRARCEAAMLEPLAEFLRRPGKGLRRDLVEATHRIGGRNVAAPLELTAVVELLHAGSLIIDDVQDGSASRRSGPSLHRMIGAPLAINAGNWLCFAAFASIDRLPVADVVRSRIHRAISATVLACHAGQSLDLSVDVTSLEQEEVEEVVAAATKLKTGSLFSLACTLAPITIGASSAIVRALDDFGRDAGVALQILDDIAGISSSKAQDQSKEDLRGARATWPWVFAARRMNPLAYAGLRALGRSVRDGSGDLERLAFELREQSAHMGRRTASTLLDAALARLRAMVPDRDLLAALERIIERLELSHA